MPSTPARSASLASWQAMVVLQPTAWIGRGLLLESPRPGGGPMATRTAAAGSAHAAYNPARLFLISCLSLATGGLVFSLFANIMAPLASQFNLDAAKIGLAAGN